MSDATHGEATDSADGGDSGGGGATPTVAQTCDNSALPIPVPGSAGVEARPAIRCLAHGQVNPCGAFDGDHHVAAAEAGVCCLALANRRQAGGWATTEEAGPDGDGEWPPFQPQDTDAPRGGAW